MTQREYNGTLPVRVALESTTIYEWQMTGRGAGVGVKNNNLLNLGNEVSVTNGHPEGDPYCGQVITRPLNYRPNIPNARDPQQWCTMECTVHVSAPGQVRLGVDDRSPIYDHAQYKLSLPAGSYKFIFEGYSPGSYLKWRAERLSRFSSSGGYYGNPFWALVDSNNNQLAYDTIEENTHMDTDWLHIEYPFTLSRETQLGVMCLSLLFKARFQIVKSDVVAEPFYNTQDNISGVTTWDAYGAHIPLIIESSSGDSRKYDFYVSHKLQPNESLSNSSTGTYLVGYLGDTTIYTETDLSPTMYIKYYGGPANLYAIERPSPICIYDVHTAQNAFDSNGAAVLMPFELISNKEDKGRWDMTMKHPIDDYGKWTYIAGLNVVKVNGQLFRIDQIELIANQNQEYISAHMNHITYDLKDFWIEEAEFSVEDGTSYITQLWTHRVQDFPNQQHMIGDYEFSVTSDLSGHMDAALKDQSYIEALFGADNSMASRYNGEVYRNNFHLSINQTMENAPTGNAFAIRYGTDMTKISFRIDFSEWITNLVAVDNLGNFYACWYDTAGGEWICHHHKTKRVHFTYTPLGDSTLEMQRLIDDANAYWDVHAVPQISIEIGVANIKNDPKYEDYLNLQNFDVGYQGKIYVEHLGINTEMKITSIKRNELTGEAITIKLGSVRGSLIRQTVMSQTIVDPNSAEGVNSANNELLKDEIFELDTKYMSSSINAMEEYAIAEIEKRTVSELEGG